MLRALLEVAPDQPTPGLGLGTHPVLELAVSQKSAQRSTESKRAGLMAEKSGFFWPWNAKAPENHAAFRGFAYDLMKVNGCSEHFEPGF
jgi:hypothetical protein